MHGSKEIRWTAPSCVHSYLDRGRDPDHLFEDVVVQLHGSQVITRDQFTILDEILNIFHTSPLARCIPLSTLQGLINPRMGQCWSSAGDAVPILTHRWANALVYSSHQAIKVTFPVSRGRWMRRRRCSRYLPSSPAAAVTYFRSADVHLTWRHIRMYNVMQPPSQDIQYWPPKI